MHVESLKWDRVNECDEIFQKIIRDGSTFIINSKSINIYNLDEALDVLLALITASKNNNNSPQIFQGISLVYLELSQLHKNIAKYISDIRNYKDHLSETINSCTSIEAVDNISWVTPTVDLKSSLEVTEDIGEHHDDRYYRKDEINRIEQYNLSNETLKTIDHTHINPFPNIIVIDSGGNVVEATYEYINNTRITVSFSVPFTGKVILS